MRRVCVAGVDVKFFCVIDHQRRPLSPRLVRLGDAGSIAPTSIHVVEGGDHSLLVYKTELKARGVTCETVDLGIFGVI